MAATNTVMQRKLASARTGAGTGSRSALRALRRAVAKAALDTVGLTLAVISATQDRIGHGDLVATLAGDRMLVLLDGPPGRTGVLWMDRDAVAAIVQIQTTGQLSGTPPAPRPFTSTDAALVQPMIDAALALAEALVETPTDRACLAGYRFGAQAEDATALALEIDAERLRTFDLTVDIAAGLRQGRIGLILPEEPAMPADAQAPDGPRRALLSRQAVGALRAELRTCLGRICLPISELAAMKPGDLIELRDGRLDAVELLSIAGHRIAVAQLGQTAGVRAVRLLGGDPATPQPRADRAAAFSAVPVPQPPALAPAPAEPAAAGQAGADAAAFDDGDEDSLADLSPELAAAEISELAGLPLPAAAKPSKGSG